MLFTVDVDDDHVTAGELEHVVSDVVAEHGEDAVDQYYVPQTGNGAKYVGHVHAVIHGVGTGNGVNQRSAMRSGIDVAFNGGKEYRLRHVPVERGEGERVGIGRGQVHHEFLSRHCLHHDVHVTRRL